MPLASAVLSLIASFVVPLVLLMLGVLFAGILALRPRTRGAAVAAELAAHGAGWIAVLVYAAVWIPRARKIFQDFGIELSSLSILILQIADLMVEPAAIVIVAVGLLAADGIIYSLLWRSDDAAATRNRFSLFMTLVPTLVLLFFGTAITVPLFKLVAVLA